MIAPNKPIWAPINKAMKIQMGLSPWLPISLGASTLSLICCMKIAPLLPELLTTNSETEQKWSLYQFLGRPNKENELRPIKAKANRSANGTLRTKKLGRHNRKQPSNLTERNFERPSRNDAFNGMPIWGWLEVS